MNRGQKWEFIQNKLVSKLRKIEVQAICSLERFLNANNNAWKSTNFNQIWFKWSPINWRSYLVRMTESNCFVRELKTDWRERTNFLHLLLSTPLMRKRFLCRYRGARSNAVSYSLNASESEHKRNTYLDICSWAVTLVKCRDKFHCIYFFL